MHRRKVLDAPHRAVIMRTLHDDGTEAAVSCTWHLRCVGEDNRVQNSVRTMVETLKNIPAIIGDYVMNIPVEELDVRRGPDIWTIREHVSHIAGVQQMLYDRLLAIKESPDPVISPYFPPEGTRELDNIISLKEALSSYRVMRERQISLIEGLTARELAKKATHPEYKEYGIPILLNHMIFHEYWHMYRIEEIWLTKDGYFR